MTDVTDSLSVVTDQTDYQPGQLAEFTATGIDVGDSVQFLVTHVDPGADGILGTDDDIVLEDLTGTGTYWTVTDGGEGDLDGIANGIITTSWFVYEDALDQQFTVTATDLNSGDTASASFTDANPHTPVDASPNFLNNGLVFLTGDVNTATGTGIFPSFVTIQNTGTEEGFNTDSAPVLDTGSSPVHNHSIQFSDIPLVIGDGTNGTVNGLAYREFRLDLNEAQDSITLDALKLYFAGVGDLTSLAGLSEIYNMDGGLNGLTGGGDDVDVSVLLTAWSSGSGHSDYKILIPDSYFTNAGVSGSDYIYLYSQFSDSDSGFEEWSVGPAGVTETASITIDKVTIDDTVTGDGITVLAGESISWSYAVVNSGNVDVVLDKLTGITDDAGTPGDTSDDIHPVYDSGDVNNDGILNVGETWIYLASGTAQVGDYVNTAVASGTANGEEVTATDDSSYFGADPSIHIEKVTDDDGTSGDGLVILAGESITWRYTVTNTGNVALSNISVSDDQLGVTPLYVSGDTNLDGILDLNETWIYEATGVAIVGDYGNTGTASGDFTDDAGHVGDTSAQDDSSYFGADPAISIDKKTNGVDHGLGLIEGQAITWTYDVTATGNIGVEFDKNTGVTDDNGTPGDTSDDFHPTYVSGDDNNNGIIDLDETWHFSYNGVAGNAPYTNTATAETTFTDDAGHSVDLSASDSSDYIGFIARALTQGFWNSRSDAWDNLVGNEGKPTLAVVKSGVLSALDVNPWDGGFVNGHEYTGNGYLLLGDSNGNGDADDAHNLLISINLAKSILAASTSGDARMIMLAQAIATQLNIDNGAGQPNNLIDEAVMWLTKQGAWSGVGVNVDTNNDGLVDETFSGGKYKLAGASVSTSSAAWQTYVDVVDNGAGITEWDLDGNAGNGNQEANGEGLKNALMWFNQDQLVVSLGSPGSVGWFDGVSVTNINPNTLDEFWLTLHQTGGLTGIA